jgi:hypothetical protein
MFKAFFKEFVDRVIKSYKSTLVGVGIGIVCHALAVFAVAAESSGKPVLQVLGSLAVIIGAALKSRAL